MTGLAILLLAAAVAFGLSKRLRLPVIPLLMLSRVGLRMLAEAGDVEIASEQLSQMVELGLAVLVFTAGAEWRLCRPGGASSNQGLSTVVRGESERGGEGLAFFQPYLVEQFTLL